MSRYASICAVCEIWKKGRQTKLSSDNSRQIHSLYPYNQSLHKYNATQTSTGAIIMDFMADYCVNKNENWTYYNKINKRNISVILGLFWGYINLSKFF